VISTVAPEARHGHESRSRGFDRYKAQVCVDPDSELIDDIVVTPANVADGDVADELVGDRHDHDGDERPWSSATRRTPWRTRSAT
jgi:hypothetical protein